MTEPNWTDIMKYDGSRPEPPYTTDADCDAYKARIAELERRVDAVIKMLEPDSGQLGREEDGKPITIRITERDLLEQAHARAVAIAEGRDNG